MWLSIAIPVCVCVCVCERERERERELNEHTHRQRGASAVTFAHLRPSFLHLHPHLLPLLQLLSDAVDLLRQELVVGLSAGRSLKHGLLYLHGILDEAADPLVLESIRMLNGEDGLHSVCVCVCVCVCARV